MGDAFRDISVTQSAKEYETLNALDILMTHGPNSLTRTEKSVSIKYDEGNTGTINNTAPPDGSVKISADWTGSPAAFNARSDTLMRLSKPGSDWTSFVDESSVLHNLGSSWDETFKRFVNNEYQGSVETRCVFGPIDSGAPAHSPLPRSCELKVTDKKNALVAVGLSTETGDTTKITLMTPEPEFKEIGRVSIKQAYAKGALNMDITVEPEARRLHDEQVMLEQQKQK